MKLKQRADLHRRGILSLLLVFCFILSLSTIPWGADLVHAGGSSTLNALVRSFFDPDLTPRILRIGLAASWQTLSYAVASIALALIIALVFGVLSSGVLVKSRIVNGFFRGFLGFLRAIHELVWAWLFVAAIGLTPLAAVFALAIPYGGTLGRVFSDLLQDAESPAIVALRTSGASRLQLLCYGYFPAAFPNMLSYTMYRLECAVRSSSVLSFVGLGGLGFQIQISLQDLQYNEVWTFLYFLVALVVLIDLWSALLRRRMSE